MARVKLSLPTNASIFKTQIPVRITDLNYGGHLGNQVFLEYCHEARAQYFKSLNQSETSFFDSALIMADAQVVFRAEVFWEDTINFEVFVSEVGTYGFELFYLLTNSQNQEVARIKTGMVFFDYENRKIAKAPSDLSQKLGVSN